MRRAFFIFTLLFSLQATANEFQPLDYTESAHSLLEKYEGYLGMRLGIYHKCAEGIMAFLKKKKKLSSRFLEEAIAPIEEARDPLLRSRESFHYTTVDSVKKLVDEQNYAPLFSYGRLRHSDPQKWYFYVATDAESSSRFGPIRLTLKFKPQMKIYYPYGDSKVDKGYEGANEARIIDDLKWRVKEFEHCRSTEADGLIMLLALEDYGVGAVAYYGHHNQYCTPKDVCGFGKQWLQVLGSWAVESITAYKKE